AVHHAADAAVQLDEGQVVTLGLGLGRVFLVQIPQPFQLFLPVKGVVVEGHLGVQRQDAPVGEHHQRVDLQQGGVGRDKGLVDQQEQLGRVLGGSAVQPQSVGQVARLEAGQAD